MLLYVVVHLIGVLEYESVSGVEDKIVTIMGDEKKKELAKEMFSFGMKNNMAQIKVKDKNIKEVSEDCLEGLSLIMKNYDNISLSECFSDCKNLTTLTFPPTFNTSSVTNMSNMFYGCSSLSSLDISAFNTSSVTSMNGMFRGCSNLSSLDLSTFDTSSVTSMYGMFRGCSNLSSLNLSTFNTSNVTSMNSMFQDYSNLNSLIYLHLIQVMLQICMVCFMDVVD